jgi:hypothetical protein
MKKKILIGHFTNRCGIIVITLSIQRTAVILGGILPLPFDHPERHEHSGRSNDKSIIADKNP